MNYLSLTKEEWDKALEQLLLSHTIFASIANEYSQDYELIRSSDIKKITYNQPKPATALKSFFHPVKENVTSQRAPEKPRIIIGSPACDIEALALLDEIYLDKDFNDIFYKSRRENTLLISSDCLGVQEHCHCLSYEIRPFATKTADLAVIRLDDKMVFRIISSKGEKFIRGIAGTMPEPDQDLPGKIEKKHAETDALLRGRDGLPGYSETGKIVSEAKEGTWKKYSEKCVSCGACTTICPTCTCFLLIDKPGFEKVKQMDACQYPGFERVAGGEDSLFRLNQRFRNRYMCKYVWKPERFKSIACTGCGRCIEACIGKINKNELFRELASKV